VLHAKDGEEAAYYLELLKSEIKLAIIDINLPVLSGLDLIWRLVKRKKPEPLKIIATTSTAVIHGPLLEKVVNEFGVSAMVRKPMAPQMWRKTIQAVLSGQPGASGRARSHAALAGP